MKFSVAHADILRQKSACILVPVFEGDKLPSNAALFDNATKHSVQKLIKSGDIKGKLGECVMLHSPTGVQAERVLLVGFGKASGCLDHEFKKALRQAAGALKKTGAKAVHLFLGDVTVKGQDASWQAQQAVLLLAQSGYLFQDTKSKKTPLPVLQSVTLITSKEQVTTLKKTVANAAAIAEGVALAKNLGNLPGNICTPTYLADTAKKIAKESTKFSAKILNEKQMAALGMGSLLSVSAGSEEPAQLIVLEYKGAAKTQKPTVLVGKGITFDTGGISLKPGAGMDEMKYDMCGAASVLGTMKAIASLNPKINVVAVIAAAENMPSGKATKPGDIVTSMAGKTIEVLNTDAEGRLVLCDALTYVERFKPKAVIDIATLTGACVVALGQHASGLFSNRDELANKLRAAGESCGDRAWQMPLWDEYKQQLSSNFADLANIGGPQAGSVTAACFLSHFTENYPWAHLDIAGTAWLSGAEKGATGRPVPLLTNYLLANG